MWDKTSGFRHWVAVIVSKLFSGGGNRKTVPFTSLRIVFMKTLIHLQIYLPQSTLGFFLCIPSLITILGNLLMP